MDLSKYIFFQFFDGDLIEIIIYGHATYISNGRFIYNLTNYSR